MNNTSSSNNNPDSLIVKICFFIALTGLTLSFVGCASSTTGSEFNFTKLKQFELGRATKNDVSSTMGDPYAKYPEDNGLRSWLYLHVETKATNVVIRATTKTSGKSATFLFEGEILKDLYWEETFQGSSGSALGGGSSGKLISDTDLGRLVQINAKTDAVLESFGRPSKRQYRLEGNETWTYSYATTGKKGTSKVVVLEFENGIVTKTCTGGS